MRAPREIVECIEKYENLKAEAADIRREMDFCMAIVSEWGGSAEYMVDLFITDKASGDRISEESGEYRDQHCLGENRYIGTHYYPIEGDNRYVAYCYEI